MLTHEIAPSPLRAAIEKASGQNLKAYLQENVLAPLEAESNGERLEMIPRVIGRLMIALLNGGAFDGGQILQPATVDLMEQPHFSIHPALPGWTYGFVEMRRNGWRALQHDGQWQDSPQAQARLVIVPEAKLATFVIIEGRAGAQFWRTLDDAFFDRILPPRGGAAFDPPQTPPPDFRRASAVAGVYEASDEPLSAVAALKIQGRRLYVAATNDGGIVLSGSEGAVLAPRPGGYWGAENGNLDAVESDGRLILSSGIFRPLRPWKRPELYASFAVLGLWWSFDSLHVLRSRPAKDAARSSPPCSIPRAAAWKRSISFCNRVGKRLAVSHFQATCCRFSAIVHLTS